MNNTITIDFETRSRAKLKDVGAWKYAEHESTEIFCMAYNLTGLEVDTQLWAPGDLEPTDLFHAIKSSKFVEAHNSFFEFCIWGKVGIRLYGFPEIPLDHYRCSMSRAHAHGLPGSLANVSNALNLDIKKDKRGKYLIQKLCKPQKITKKNSEEWCNDPSLKHEMYGYCKTDVNTELQLSRKLPHLIPAELETWKLDQRINARGVGIDLSIAKGAMKLVAAATTYYGSKIAELSKGEFLTTGQRAKILKWCAAQGVVLPGWTKKDVSDALQLPNLPAPVKQLLEIRQILGKTSIAKYKAMINKTAKDGRVHETLVYHKAHTGRWAGVGIQVQNLPRPTIHDDPELLVELVRSGDFDKVHALYPDPLEVAVSTVRSAVVPDKGNKFISADYASIEARVLFWVAGDKKALQTFMDKKDLYVEMAAEIFNRDYAELYSSYKQGDATAGTQRALGKAAILGLGFQMGADTFVKTCASSGIIVSDEMGQRVVQSYRAKFSKVKKLWYEIESKARLALENPGVTFALADGKIKFKKDGMFLKCRLPSGRILHYPYPTIKDTRTSWGDIKATIHYKTQIENKWGDKSTFGGRLTENVVQAIARDLMRDAALLVDALGYTLVMSVHDELLAEVPEGFGSVEEFCYLMCQKAAWADGLPVVAEGWTGKRYRK